MRDFNAQRSPTQDEKDYLDALVLREMREVYDDDPLFGPVPTSRLYGWVQSALKNDPAWSKELWHSEARHMIQQPVKPSHIRASLMRLEKEGKLSSIAGGKRSNRDRKWFLTGREDQIELARAAREAEAKARKENQESAVALLREHGYEAGLTATGHIVIEGRNLMDDHTRAEAEKILGRWS